MALDPSSCLNVTKNIIKHHPRNLTELLRYMVIPEFIKNVYFPVSLQLDY